MSTTKAFQSALFPITPFRVCGTMEQIVVGSRQLFPLLPQAFGNAGIKQIAVIGFGSQGSAQPQNLRDSLKGTDVKVVVGLRAGSGSMKKARQAGFTEEDGKLGEMFEVIKSSDMVILLISDAACVEWYKDVFAAMKPGATLGLSHGFLRMHMDSIGETWPEHINVIMVAPKGMGYSLRILYQQGETTDGAGINASFAVEQDISGGKMIDVALAWSIGIGSPSTFQTTLLSEVISDIFGERGDLLGGVWAITEVVYRQNIDAGMTPHEAFASVESLTGPITKAISKVGMIGLYNMLDDDQKVKFALAYSASYDASMLILEEIYDEVASGNEVRSVVLAGNRLKNRPMSKVGDTPMWRIGKEVRTNRTEVAIDPHVAGMYVGMMMAQVDLLRRNGHCWSEIINESVIEATDSLTPYMDKHGVSAMVDGCSVTARLGTRKWGPRFEKALDCAFGQELPLQINTDLLSAFKSHPAHEAWTACAQYRPKTDIIVP